MEIEEYIRKRAFELGFHAVGFAAVGEHSLATDVTQLTEWLAAGHHAGMSYLERWLEVRGDPANPGMVAGAQTVITLALAYDATSPRTGLGRWLASFARGPDYHDVVRQRLTTLLQDLRRRSPDVRGRALVDSAPILERAWASRAGLGWIGRNTTLIHPELGSLLVLGELVVTARLRPTAPATFAGCGSCRACIDACPTGALTAPDGHVLDARRCLSYWTIEARDPLPSEIAALEAFFGCDVCQLVCPWNHHRRAVTSPLAPLARWSEVTLAEVATMDRQRLASLIAGTALERAGPDKLAERARTLIARQPG